MFVDLNALQPPCGSSALTTGTKVVDFKHHLMLSLIPWISMPRAAPSHSQSSILKSSAPVCSVISAALCIYNTSLKCPGLRDVTYLLEWLFLHPNRLTLVTCSVLLAHRHRMRTRLPPNVQVFFQARVTLSFSIHFNFINNVDARLLVQVVLLEIMWTWLVSLSFPPTSRGRWPCLGQDGWNHTVLTKKSNRLKLNSLTLLHFSCSSF